MLNRVDFLGFVIFKRREKKMSDGCPEGTKYLDLGGMK
jgi:hypothetical protein